MSSFPLDPGTLDVSYQPMESFSNFLRHATLGTMTLPSGPSEFGPCFRTPGLPPISCPTIWQNFQQLKPLLLLGGFPLDRGPLPPCLNPDLNNYCTVTEETGRSSNMRQDLRGRLAC